MGYTITKVEGRSKSFNKAKELLDELGDRNNGWWEGRGSVIETDGAEIFNTTDYVRTLAALDNGQRVSIKKVVEDKANRAKMFESYDQQWEDYVNGL